MALTFQYNSMGSVCINADGLFTGNTIPLPPDEHANSPLSRLPKTIVVGCWEQRSSEEEFS